MPGSRGYFVGSTSASTWEIQTKWSETTALCIRAIQASDLEAVANVLTHSFHVQDSWWGWAYPLLRLSIQEDLRVRLRSGEANRLCLIAVEQNLNPSTQAPSTEQLALCPALSLKLLQMLENHPERLAPKLSKTETLAGTVELGLRAPMLWQSFKQRQLYISNLAVALPYRRRGAAQALLLACERAALAWGFSEIYLHVLENNLAARRLYTKLGYRLEQVEHGLAHWLFAQPRQFLLRKVLNNTP